MDVTVSVRGREWVAVADEVSVVLRFSESVIERLAVVEILDERVVFIVSDRETLIPEVADKFSFKVVFIVSPMFKFKLWVILEVSVELRVSVMETVGEVVTVPDRVEVMLSERLTL
ncbi:MAG: hypothetical protein QW687_02895 [Candidatus Hadarchaeales archaeon]